MRRIALLTASIVAIATTAGAQVVTYYMHKSANPVAIPGGLTIFTIDETAPAASTPVAASVSVSKGTTQSFPTFIAPTFAAPATLGLDFDVVAHLSANLAMNNNCAIVDAVIERVDSSGARSFLAQGRLLTGIPQGGSGGTTGFAARNVSVSVGCDRPTDDVTIAAGESIAVTIKISNACRANRTVSLAYDGTSAPTIATFAPTLPPDEVFFRACFAKCQQGASKAITKFLAAKNRCATKCQQNARKGYGSYSDCFAPYGGATLECILDPLKGAEAKALAAIQRVCTPIGRCPPCYGGGDCTTHSFDLVQNFEGAFDSFGPGVWCENTGASLVAKCEDNTAKTIWKYYAVREKCYERCFTNEAKGLVLPNSCLPPVSDPAAAGCMNAAASKATLGINKYCSDLGVDPSCGYPSGSGWTSLTGIAVDGFIPQLFCGE